MVRTKLRSAPLSGPFGFGTVLPKVRGMTRTLSRWLIAGAATALLAWFGRASWLPQGGAPVASADVAAVDDSGEAEAPTVDGEPASVRAPAALPVDGAIAQRGPFVMGIRATGRAEARQRAELSLPVSERIAAVRVTEGDHVAAGQTLVELDRRPFEISLREAEARRATAESDFRILLLSEADVGEERRALAEHRSGLTQAREGVERATFDLEGTRLVAPFDGWIADVRAQVGERAATTPLVTLVDLANVRIRAEVLESDLGRIRKGANATVRFVALPGETFTGEVVAVGPEVDAARGTGIVYVALSNPEARIKPGMYAELDVAGDVHGDRISVPRDAVLERDQRLLVFRAQNGRAEWQYVETGLESQGLVEITSGVAEGDTVLTGGHLTLAHGAPVQVRLR
jgi:RND family efflux transporter MFP subunit